MRTIAHNRVEALSKVSQLLLSELVKLHCRAHLAYIEPSDILLEPVYKVCDSHSVLHMSLLLVLSLRNSLDCLRKHNRALLRSYIGCVRKRMNDKEVSRSLVHKNDCVPVHLLQIAVNIIILSKFNAVRCQSALDIGI